ncbi:hypothetical protein [Stenotrophomonas sp. 364]|jgi:hypothetical protein|uniref:hypothetical protein n=1 Tax=Stenotrophomonas sp. 364 TaxID=2691571 RepID=UPI0013181D8F|nr:hypothetical protein [Stenotrophomonas sp. 364]QHB72587.1 hypothetical protein GQ674_15375 [Stenotrophomonas sp. 364]
MAVQTEFVQKLLSDPAFAEQLRSQALAAVLGGQQSPAWKTYFGGQHFAAMATDPGKLQALGASANAAACTCNSTTVTTTTSPICTGTTTTGSG